MNPPKRQPGAAPAEHSPSTRSALAGVSEGEIVARVLGGDRAAFSELVRRYHGPLLRLALALVRNRALAEEIVQDTWLGVRTRWVRGPRGSQDVDLPDPRESGQDPRRARGVEAELVRRFESWKASRG